MRSLAWVAIACACASGMGCGPSAKDIATWEASDERGPEKLAEVVASAKAKIELRREAALALTRTKRAGHEVGLDALGTTLAAMPEEERARVVDAIAPELVGAMEPSPPFSGKDAAYLLLSRDLVSTPATKETLRAALVKWIATDTASRLENRSQRFSVQQATRLLGADGARALVPAFSAKETRALAPLVALVAEVGDAETKARACEALVAVDAQIASPAWRAEARKLIEESNAKTRTNATPAQVDAQLASYEAAEREWTFGAMKKLGGAACAARAIAVASDAATSKAIAESALSSLATHVAGLAPPMLDALAAIAHDTKYADEVRAAAIARLGESRENASRLYAIFDAGWILRFEAARAILATARAGDVPDFIARLPDKGPFGLAEAIHYGNAIAKLDGGVAALAPYLGAGGAHKVTARLVALGAFYGRAASERATVAAFESDTRPVPKCEATDGCAWRCDTHASGGIGTTQRDVATVADFVRYCIEPSLGEKNAKLPVGPIEAKKLGLGITNDWETRPVQLDKPVPTPNVTMALPENDQVPNAQRVLAGFRPRARMCYSRGLAEDPSQHGKMVLVINVAADGTVSSVAGAKKSGISDAVANCVANSARNLQFERGPSGGAKLEVPITFDIVK